MSVNKAKVVSELLGLGSGGGELHKLTIYYEQGGAPGQGSIEALFNPSEISLTRSTLWEQQQTAGWGGPSGAAVEQEFRSLEAEGVSIELFFDTYGSRSGAVTSAAAASFLPASPAPRGESSDVRQYTDQIAKLAGLSSSHVRGLIYPSSRGKPPFQKVRRETAERILAAAIAGDLHVEPDTLAPRLAAASAVTGLRELYDSREARLLGPEPTGAHLIQLVNHVIDYATAGLAAVTPDPPAECASAGRAHVADPRNHGRSG